MIIWLAFCVPLFHTVLGQFLKNESSLALLSHRPRSHVTHGIKLEYKLEVFLEIEHDAKQLEIQINGTHLVALEDTELMQTNMTWIDKSGQIVQDSNAAVDWLVELAGFPNPSDTIIMLVPTKQGSSLLWSLSANLRLYVSDISKGNPRYFWVAYTLAFEKKHRLDSDEAPLCFLLRPLVYVTLSAASSSVTQRALVVGQYTFLEMPEVILSSALPPKADMKQRPKVMTSIVLPDGPMQRSALNIYMPYNITVENEPEHVNYEEPFLTLTGFEYVGSSGLSMASIHQLDALEPIFQSNTRTSEQEDGFIVIPPMSINTVPAQIDFEAEAEMLDFAGLVPGAELTIVHIFQPGIGFFIVKNFTIIADLDESRTRSPNLTTSLELLETFQENESLALHFLVGVNHSEKSWGSAYNVSLVVYLPPFLGGVTLIKVSDFLPSSTNVMTIHDNVNLEFGIKRISFVHSPRIHINVTVDVTDDLFAVGDSYRLVVGAVYTGWRDTEDLGTLDNFNVNIGENEENPGCEDENGDECEPCHTPWTCVKMIKGHGLKSKLRDSNGTRYFCSPAKTEQNASEIVPCIRVDKHNDVTELDPGLGTLLGASDEEIYGIASNGLAYMVGTVSGQVGTTGSQAWYSVGEGVYKNASLLRSFIAAELSPTD